MTDFRIERPTPESRLILGDCLDVLAGWKPYHPAGLVHVITDPPYENRLHAAKDGTGRALRTDGGPEGRALTFAGIDAIRADFIDAIAPVLTGWLIAFCTPEGVAPWADVINASRLRYKRACIWVKPDAAPQMNGQGPAAGYESFVCAWGGAGFSKWNAGGKRGVYTHLTNPPDRDGRHETEKPRRLMAELIADFTAPGDLVLDPFAGSGTTGVAAHEQGRAFVGVERDPKFFDIAVERVTVAARQHTLFPAMARKAGQESFL